MDLEKPAFRMAYGAKQWPRNRRARAALARRWSRASGLKSEAYSCAQMTKKDVSPFLRQDTIRRTNIGGNDKEGKDKKGQYSTTPYNPRRK